MLNKDLSAETVAQPRDAADCVMSSPAFGNKMLAEALSVKPILFSTEMVKAIVEGRKTQTRRIVKPQPEDDCYYEMKFDNDVLIIDYNQGNKNPKIKCPYGKVGDVLYVKETFAYEKYFNGLMENDFPIYKADFGDEPAAWNWHPSLFMPKNVARIFLKITKIKVEQLSDMNEDDAIAEGVELIGGKINDAPVFRNYKLPKGHSVNDGYGYPTNSFRSLWNAINKNYNGNTWVWVIEFQCTERPEGFC